MRFVVSALIFLLWHLCSLHGQINSLIMSGPMLGPMTTKDVTIWIQVREEAKLHIEYAEVGSTVVYKSDIKKAKSTNDFIVNWHLFPLKENTSYQYRIINDNSTISPQYTFKTPHHWRFRMDPPDFSFLTGSCLYINDSIQDRPGVPYGGSYEILSHMAKDTADFMLWLGDNTYLREGDFESRNGIYYRQTHTRKLVELQPLLSKMAHYAIWDDHDYGPNDSDWTYPLKNHSREAFKDFWPSESYGAGNTEGITSSFIWNDCSFFLLDNRWYRTVDKRGTILGDQQKYWLKESLLSAPTRYKFIAVGGQFLSDFAGFENFANYAEERQEIIDFIDDNNISNVIFLTGDRHHSEITKLVTAKGNIIYDVTSSAITSTTYDHKDEPNSFRVAGSMIAQRNYTKISISGNKKERMVTIEFIDKEGNKVFTYQINQ